MARRKVVHALESGAVIRVGEYHGKDPRLAGDKWPGTDRERYVVTEVHPNTGATSSHWPVVVEALRVDKIQSGYELAARRTFGLDYCVVDQRATDTFKKHHESVARRRNKHVEPTKPEEEAL
jgi:hypothetical protein